MRIGVAVDAPAMAQAIERALATEPSYRVVWIAHSGEQAVELSANDTPDLVLMDLFIPWMGGVEATRRIMTATPCAILIMVGDVATRASQVFQAMVHGALDAVDTPELGDLETQGLGSDLLLAKVKSIDRLIGSRPSKLAAHETPHGRRSLAVARELVVIGASAGGPAALLRVLQDLPKDFGAAIVVVQHVDERFAPGMASWLAQNTQLPVRLVKDGDVLTPGVIYVPRTNDHLVLKNSSQLGYSPAPKECVYRPSIDVFFDQVSRHWTGQAVGVLLTGMGRDGAAGLKALRDKGHHTIAQNRASSLVYGMPKAAAELGAAVDILPLDRIAGKLQDSFPGRI